MAIFCAEEDNGETLPVDPGWRNRGHMFPAQALAEAMLNKGWRVRLSTDERGARYIGAFPQTAEIVEVASATFARGGLAATTKGTPATFAVATLIMAEAAWA